MENKWYQKETLQSLIDIGCDINLCQAAVRNCKSNDLDDLIDWMAEENGNEEQWKVWLKQHPDNQAPKTIGHLVSTQMVEKLQKYGFSKNVAEKALLFTNNSSVESAETWIQNHKQQENFESPFLLEGQFFQESTMTHEKAMAKLQQLTQRAIQIKVDKADEDQKRQLAAIQRQKYRGTQKYKLQQVELRKKEQIQRNIRRQQEEIQRIKDEEYLAEKKKEKQIEEEIQRNKPPQQKYRERLILQCEQVKVGMHARPEQAKIFFETAQRYVGNILKYNGGQKYLKINKDNKIFKERLSVFGGIEVLQAVGFQQKQGALIMQEYNQILTEKAFGILGKYKQLY